MCTVSWTSSRQVYLRTGPLSEYLSIYLSVSPYYVVARTQKYNGEMWFEKKSSVRYENIAQVSLHIRNYVLVL